MLRTVNRVLIGLVGLVLLVFGGAALAVGLGASPPFWWIYGSRHDVVLSDAQRTKYTDSGWWWPTVIASLAVLVLLSLWWLVAVVRRHRLAEVLVDTGDQDTALLRGRALEHVLAAEAAGQEGVRHVHVQLRGRRDAPAVRVRLQVEPHVDPAAALHELTAEALAHARDSARLAALPAEVRLRGVKHRAERVS
ncbi:alkaline shock response membrane anchor protein AmaP [Streptomyces mangrovisoli]|uniref:Alkaline shock response membrane anchor protein AmaP n=1 Tax=Streptomyces mangrovisoli TaxID=1428628 RepID=A0A1J4NY45_9ACTN|nr:alkaline shock response membrane anchor protein AmaP [Streptomyces mangrovisoli]OIJ66149.1 hypothetical protein WN71_019895 [Streptomyces mangrovisoli]